MSAILGITAIIALGFVLILACIEGVARRFKPREDSFDDRTDWPGVALGESAPGVSGSGGGVSIGDHPASVFSLSHGAEGTNTCFRQ